MKTFGASFMAMMLLMWLIQPALSQGSRIRYQGREIFISGINIAWSSNPKYGQDLGPGPVDTAAFKTIFSKVRENGGNVLRLWLHTNGAQSPTYNASGYTSGPGPVAIRNLRQILDLAQRYKLGMILCLWTHNMLSTSQLSGSDAPKLTANLKLLTDTSYTMAYVRNALIPMVDSVKGHPAIASWEIFNEAEGISDKFGWGGFLHVQMADIQRCVNLMAGAIHRTDPSVLVTNGAVTFQTQTDVNPLAKTGMTASDNFNSLSAYQQSELVAGFNAGHQSSFTVDGYRRYLEKIAAYPNQNYYSDARLVASGGDQQGILDYYSVHYYQNNGILFSPFRHPASYWQLDKQLIVAEFHMNEEYSLPHDHLFPYLYDNGYAGALVWSWTDFPVVGPNSESQTWQALNSMVLLHHADIVVSPLPGTIYSFSADPQTIQKYDSTVLSWDVEPGGTVTLNGSAVASTDSMPVAPLSTATYTLIAQGQMSDTSVVTVKVLPAGTIVTFSAIPAHIAIGENSKLKWKLVKGSSATLNGITVGTVDSMTVHPDASHFEYTLRGSGETLDSATIEFLLLPASEVNRAYGTAVTVSSNDTIAYSASRPENIVDGDDGSRWQASSTPLGQPVRIDLGIAYTINSIVIRWGNQLFARMYAVQLSLDGNTWTTVYSLRSGTGGTNGVETIGGLTVVGRFINLNLQLPAKTAYSIAEISVYGSQAVTGTPAFGDVIPKSYSLAQNFPNPFNLTTSINFSIVAAEAVKLTVSNVLGQIVDVPVDDRLNPGVYTVTFDATRLASGVYFYRLEAGKFVSTKKMLLLK